MGAVYQYHAFLYSADVMQDLGALPGGTWTEATAINASGDVTGMGDTAAPNVYHAFLYSHGVMQDLGAPPGTMPTQVIFPRTGVDSADDVVWSAGSFPIGNNSNTAEHGFIYRQDQGWTDLNTLLDPNDPLAAYVVIMDATAINDAGVILADGFDKRSAPAAVQHTYLLTPAMPPAQSSDPSPCVGASSSSSSSSSSDPSSSSSASASSSSSASVGPTGNSQAVYPTSSGSTGGAGDFDALTLALLAGAVLRAAFLRRAPRTLT
jgi:probable HAF family extracellular repeat protein